MWQFIQDYWTWLPLGLTAVYMIRMHMGGGHGMHGMNSADSAQGAAPQPGIGHQHGSQPQPTPVSAGEEKQGASNAPNSGDTDNAANGASAAGSDRQIKQAASAHGGHH